MKREDVRFKMLVIVTKGFYQDCVGRVICQDEDKIVVALFSKGKNAISRLFNIFSSFERVLHVDEIEPL